MQSPQMDVDAVNPDAVELMIGESRIGSRIKQLRLKRSMGLVELGQLTGLSASFLSQLETGRVVPTLRNLSRLSLAFGKDLSYFFQPEKHSFFRMQRRKDRIRLPQPRPTNPSHIAESFGILVPDRSLGPCLAEFFPHSEAPPFEARVFQGHEMIYMLAGSLEVEFGSRTEILEAGDVAFLDASTARRMQCSGEVPANALIISMPFRGDRDLPRNGRL
jgi:transcriptional regulator with XRE-family HTH domain